VDAVGLVMMAASGHNLHSERRERHASAKNTKRPERLFCD